jgi:hypothetical protein
LHRARQQIEDCLKGGGGGGSYQFVPRNAPRPPSAVIIALCPKEFLIYVPSDAAEA